MNQSKRQPSWFKLAQTLGGGSRVLLTSVGVAGCVILLRLSGFLQPWELGTLDQTFQLRPAEPTDDRIVIVGINENDLRQVKQWPISDRLMAQLLQKIQTARPRAIGLDIYRDLPVEPGHNELLATYRTLPHLVGIEQIKDKTSPGVPPPAALNSTNQVGFNNLVFDLDGKVRRGLLFWTADGKDHRSFSLALALLYLQSQNISPQPAQSDPRFLQLGPAVFRRFAAHDGAYVQVDAGGYQYLANLRGGANHFRHVSMSDVLEGRVPPELLRDRIVLVGSTAVSLKDFFYTSYSGGLTGDFTPQPMAGVELQAHLISQIISAATHDRPLLQVWSPLGEWLWILVWAWVGARISWKLGSPRRAGSAILLAAGGLVSICYLAFLRGWWIPLVPPGVAMVASTVGIIAHVIYLQDELKRSKEFLSKIINTIPDPIFVKDQQHRWVVLNQAYCRFLGYSQAELLAKTDTEVFPSHEVQVFRQQDQQVFDHSQELEHEEDFTDRSGKTHQIATKRSLHKDAAGNRFLVGVIRDITERKQMEEELKRTAAELVQSNAELQLSADRMSYLANHDTLTGLPNRKLFQERLGQAIAWAQENGQQVALLFLDLDGFKQINDSFGHDMGDLLLKSVSRRLTGCLRGSDTVSRLGGDEFTVILPAIPTAQDAARVADKILSTLSKPFEIQDHAIDITISIGVSLYPHLADSVESLLKSADTAMYQAKDLGKNRHQFAFDRNGSSPLAPPVASES
jgi:diguanylate cyclase (GGDEF)-like protein/PAS domain S-box-containing protein